MNNILNKKINIKGGLRSSFMILKIICFHSLFFFFSPYLWEYYTIPLCSATSITLRYRYLQFSSTSHSSHFHYRTGAQLDGTQRPPEAHCCPSPFCVQFVFKFTLNLCSICVKKKKIYYYYADGNISLFSSTFQGLLGTLTALDTDLFHLFCCFTDFATLIPWTHTSRVLNLTPLHYMTRWTWVGSLIRMNFREPRFVSRWPICKTGNIKGKSLLPINGSVS